MSDDCQLLIDMSTNQRSSIRDVARKAGVSHTTASLALRGDPRITTTTRRRVERSAQQLAYRPHAAVATLMAQLRNLKTRTASDTIGFLTSWPTREGWREVVHNRRFFTGAEERGLEKGYKTEVFWLREPGMTGRRMSQILRARGIRGLVLYSLPKAHGHVSLEWQHFAAVTKGLTIIRPKLHRVISSHFEDMRLVTHHLQRLGYRRPGLALSEDANARVGQAWLAAYLLQQYALPEAARVPAKILEMGNEREAFAAWFREYQPEVILYPTLPVGQWVADLGLRVPEDVGLVHLDCSNETGNLSGINAQPEVLGAAAVDLLVGQLHAYEYGIPQREKIIAVSGSWAPGATLRQVGSRASGRTPARKQPLFAESK